MRCTIISLVLLGSLSTTPCLANPDSSRLFSTPADTSIQTQNSQTGQVQAVDWLRQMSRAAKEANYQGIVMFGGRRGWHTLAIEHQNVDGTEYEKISHLTGMPKEIVRVAGRVVWSNVAEKIGKVHKESIGLLSGGAESRIDDVAKHYELRLMGVDRVAGRIAQRLELKPADRYRFGQSLWLDQESGLLLRCDLQNEEGRVVERFQFATVAMGLPDTTIEDQLKQQGFSDSAVMDDASIMGDVSIMGDASVETTGMVAASQMSPSEAAAKSWGPKWLPPGFSRVIHSMNAQMPPAMDRIQTYSDGISAFSLFLDRVKDKKMPDMDQRWGATSAVVRHTGKRDDKMRVTVVGEIPMKTARSVAKSVYISDN